MNKYIVAFKNDAPEALVDKTIADVESAGGIVTNRYNGGALLGFSAAIPDSHLQQLQASAKSQDSKISYIEPSGVMRIQK